MQKIARFEKVSATQFAKDWTGIDADVVYPSIELPRRATIGSAGYDFFSPMAFTLQPQESILIPTGVRVSMQHGWMLQIYPRSGLGFRYRLQLNNTVGIIDSDYYMAKNEGHIQIKLTNDSYEHKILQVCAGEAFAQGVFLPFGITEDDFVTEERVGGFGSTTAAKKF